MDKYTWVYITIRIDMKVTSSSCNTSAYELTIILEIHNKDFFSTFHRTNLTDSVIDIFTLFVGRHQIRSSFHTYRHQMEIPCKTASMLDQKIKKFVRCNSIHVFASIAYTVSENQSVLM